MKHRKPYTGFPPIGIGGRKRSGKDTFGRLLALELQTYNLRPSLTAFADTLRDILAATDPIIDISDSMDYEVRLSEALEYYGDWEGLKESPYAGEVRVLMQRMGTEGLRAQDQNFFTRRMAHQIEMYTTGPTIVTDVRFDNEASCITDLDGVLVHVARDQSVEKDQHASETDDLELWADFSVVNTWDTDCLNRSARGVAEKYVKYLEHVREDLFN